MAELVTVDVPDFIEESSEYDTQYKRSMRWDVELGDFVLDGANKVQEATGYEAYIIWCYKMAQTERYSCAAYPDDIGTEFEEIIGEDDHEIAETEAERTLTDALMVNPRTEFVSDFEFLWVNDDLYVTFNVKGIEWEQVFQLTVVRR